MIKWGNRQSKSINTRPTPTEMIEIKTHNIKSHTTNTNDNEISNATLHCNNKTVEKKREKKLSICYNKYRNNFFVCALVHVQVTISFYYFQQRERERDALKLFDSSTHFHAVCTQCDNISQAERRSRARISWCMSMRWMFNHSCWWNWCRKIYYFNMTLYFKQSPCAMHDNAKLTI